MFQARFAFAFALAFVFIPQAFAQQTNGPVIFDVRRSLPLEPDEPVTKDFYINAGPESGMKKGVYISVVRAVPVHDPIKNMQQATLKIPVGKLKVVDVQRGITVARLETELTDDDRPTLEFEGVMVGDYVDLATMSTEEPKKPKPRKRMTAAAPVLSPVAAPAEAGSLAAGLAAISAAPDSAIAHAAPATVEAPAPTGAPTPLTTNATVVTEETNVAPTPAASKNTSATPAPKPEEAPKKSSAPKSAESEKEMRSLAQTDSVRVADYTDAGF